MVRSKAEGDAAFCWDEGTNSKLCFDWKVSIHKILSWYLRAMEIRGQHDDGVSQDVGGVGGRELLVLRVGLEEPARKLLHQTIDLLGLAWTIERKTLDD